MVSFYSRRWPEAVPALAVLVLSCGLVIIPVFRAGSQDMPSAAAAVVRGARALPFAGTASCSARGCHGGIAPRTGSACRQNEFTLWQASDDPHLRAWHVLQDERSRKMARTLGITDPARDKLCLACHTNPWAAVTPKDDGAAELVLAERLFGVGCESCHGSAKDWLAAHTEPSWRRLSPTEKAARGMRAWQDPAARAEMCVGCHVGSSGDGTRPAGDANHDLYAAGHPRLHFEPSTFLANLPPHWDPLQVQRAHRKEGQSWAAGQVVAARAALELLAFRAGDESHPWPEFAEYSCYGCHHDLRDRSWRQERSAKAAEKTEKKAGSLPWGTWYFSGPRHLAGGPFKDQELFQPLQQLEEIMTASLRPDRKVVRQRSLAADKALERLQDRIASASWEDRHAKKTLVSLGNLDPDIAGSDWEHAEQRFLGLWALNRQLKSPPVERTLHELLEVRAFPTGLQLESPARFRPNDFFSKLQESLKRLQDSREPETNSDGRK